MQNGKVYADQRLVLWYNRGSSWERDYYVSIPSGFSSSWAFSTAPKVETLRGGTLSQSSMFSNPFNIFDVNGVGPRLSTGRCERHCHHDGWVARSYPSTVNGKAVRSYSHTDPDFSQCFADGRVPLYTTKVRNSIMGTDQVSLVIDSFQLAGSMGTHFTYDYGSGCAVLEFYLPGPDGYALTSTCTAKFTGKSGDRWSEWSYQAVCHLNGETISGKYTLSSLKISAGIVARPPDPPPSSSSLLDHGDEISAWYANAYLQAGKDVYSYDVNNLENLFTAQETKGLFQLSSWVPRQGQSILKWISSTYLAYTYGVRPLVSDLKASLGLIADAASGGYLPSRVARYSSAHFGDMECHLKIVLRNPSGFQYFSDVGAMAAKASVALSAENLWDLVPYSFIVDWVFPIGDMLSRMSAFNDTSRRWEFEYASLSRKVTNEAFTGSSIVTRKAYDRHILDAPPSRLAVMHAARGTGINVPAATALAINLFL